MPLVTGVTIVGRQVLMPYQTISDGKMSLVLNGQNPNLPKLYGRISIELNGGGTVYFQIYDQAIWVPGTYWSVNTRLLPGSYRAAAWWKIAGLSYQFSWV